WDKAVPEARRGLPEAASLRIRHPCGGDPERVLAAYRSAGVAEERLEVARFFPNAAELMARSAVAISRAGALTLAEAAGYGVGPILVPHPHADGPQLFNAKRHAAALGSPIVEEGPDLPARLRTALKEALAVPPPTVRRLTSINPAAEIADVIRDELRRPAG
ncbi:MAG: glycosyltransferase, partial [Planctomycetota bacterium]